MSLTKITIINKENNSFEELDLMETLFSVREKLEKKNKIDDELSFSQKFDDEFIEITRGNEKDFILKDIIEKDSNKLYLIKITSSCWKFLNRLHNLDYGWKISSKELKRANGQAFTLQSAEMRRIDEKRPISGVKVSYKKDDPLFFISDNNVQNFAELLKVNSENIQFYWVEKACFENCKFKAGKDFNDAVKDAVKDENFEQVANKFKKIIRTYGQFIPTKISFGARTESQTDEGSQGTLKYCRNWDCIEFQEQKSIFHFVEDSLREKIYSFFGKRILHSEITTIEYDNADNDDDDDDNIKNKTKIIKLPKSVSGIISNKCSECSIFATVVGVNDYYHCQILTSSGNVPRLMIRRLKKKLDNKLQIGWIVVGYDTYLKFISSNNKYMIIKKEYTKHDSTYNQTFKLGLSKSKRCIGTPIIDTESDLLIGHYFSKDYNKLYTFAYSLKGEKDVELPTFKFDVLVIPDNLDNDPTMILFGDKLNGSINFDNIEKNLKDRPKFVSLCSDKYEQKILLKQTLTQIKVQCLGDSPLCDFNYLLFIPFKRYFFFNCTS
jgi:hypothetical protein